MKPKRLLVVDDDGSIRELLGDYLRQLEYQVVLAETFEEACSRCTEGTYSAALVDIVLAGRSGLDLLPELRQENSHLPIIMMTSHASIETAVEAMRRGAYDYIRKPFDPIDDVGRILERAVEHGRLRTENDRLVSELMQRNLELDRNVQRLTSLNAAGRAMGTILRVQELLDYFVQLVVQELQVERASVMLIDEAENVLKIVASHGIPADVVAQVRVRLGDGVAGWVAKKGKPILVKDVLDDPRIEAKRDGPYTSDSFISSPIVMSVPIKKLDKTLGVINVTHKRSRQPFVQDDMVFLYSLAGQAAVAIEAAAHFEDLIEALKRLKETESQLVTSERRSAIGQMTAGFAHDFNDLLNGILSRAQLMLDQLGPESDNDKWGLVRDLHVIEQLTLQGADLIRRVQEFTGVRRPTTDESVDLSQICREAVEMLRPLWQEEARPRGWNYQIRTSLAESATVQGNGFDLLQSVIQILSNAVEAMPGGGEISLSTATRDGRVTLSVEDRGEGMDEETRRRACEPFFSTRGSGRGLGLSVVYGVVKRHGGSLKIESEPGSGSRMVLEFPISTSLGVTAEIQVQEQLSESARLLIAEDQVQVREVLVQMFSRTGFEVTAVDDGDRALDAMGEKEFDVLLTDLSMPGASGWDLSKRIRQKNGHIGIVVLSGWVVPEDDRRIRECGIDFVLTKPSSVDELRQTVVKAANLNRARKRKST